MNLVSGVVSPSLMSGSASLRIVSQSCLIVVCSDMSVCLVCRLYRGITEHTDKREKHGIIGVQELQISRTGALKCGFLSIYLVWGLF